MNDSFFRQLWVEPSGPRGGSALAALAGFDLPSEVGRLASHYAWLGAAEMDLESDAFLGDDGEVAVAFYAGTRCVELVFSPDEPISLVVEDGVGFDFQELHDVLPAGHDEIVRQLQSLSLLNSPSWMPVWNSSGSSSFVGGTRTDSVFPMSPSSDPLVMSPGPPTVEPEFQYSS